MVGISSLALYWQPHEKVIYSETTYTDDMVRDLQFAQRIARASAGPVKGRQYIPLPCAPLQWEVYCTLFTVSSLNFPPHGSVKSKTKSDGPCPCQPYPPLSHSSTLFQANCVRYTWPGLTKMTYIKVLLPFY